MILFYTLLDFLIKYITKCVKKIKTRPKIFKYKRIQKKRFKRTFETNPLLTNGSSGLLLLQALQLTSNHLNKFKLFLKKSTKNFDKTKRFCWFSAFPQLPLTQKSTGARMGKGKGKIQTWFIKIKPGRFLFEFINLRNGRSRYFMMRIKTRINAYSKLYFTNYRYISCPFYSSKKFKLSFFWC